MSNNAKILFIGGGNMARAIVSGLVESGHNSQHLTVVDRNADKLTALQVDFQIQVAAEPHRYLSEADILILAVKPQGAKELCVSLQDDLRSSSALVVSIMAGVELANLEAWLGAHLAIVRVMPNTPAAIREGASAYFANSKTSQMQERHIEMIFKAVGVVAKMATEDQLNMMTAFSGSGPAYYFYFMELMQNIAIKMGIAPDVAKRFAVQTAYGATKLAYDSAEDVASLRAKVTSKKGTTDAAITTMQALKLDNVFEQALHAAYERAVELSRIQLG